jgi:hypothetical protein
MWAATSGTPAWTPCAAAFTRNRVHFPRDREQTWARATRPYEGLCIQGDGVRQKTWLDQDQCDASRSQNRTQATRPDMRLTADPDLTVQAFRNNLAA